jgi:predicted metalloprotease with PDZ domain
MRAYVAAVGLLLATPAWSQTARPLKLEVDAREAPRRLLHAHLTVPGRPGPLTLLYPKWLPGEHGPSGPVVNLSGLQVTAGGKPVEWRRDAENMHAFHVAVPAGASALVVEFDYLLPVSDDAFGGSASSTSELMVLPWNLVLLYVEGTGGDEQQVEASLTLPQGWPAGSALPVARQAGARLSFAPVSLTTLVDSPVLAGRFTRTVPLLDKPPVRLFIAADSEAALQGMPELLAALARLPVEANALFGATHYRTYTFLLTLADSVRWFGLEHHESSDNRTGERNLIDDDARVTYGSLLPHEMVHSWNG